MDAAEGRDEIEKAQIYRRTRLRLQWRPDLLQVLCVGAGSQIANASQMAGRYPLANDFPRPIKFVLLSASNYYFESFPPLDLPTAVLLVGTLLAVLLGYDIVSGAKEDGTLALCMSYPVRRSQFLLGEAAGAFLALALTVVGAFAVAVAVLAVESRGVFLGDLWLRLAALFSASLLLVLTFLLLSLLVSTVTSTSVTSLVALLLIWTTTCVLLPDVFGWLSTSRTLPEASVDVLVGTRMPSEASSSERVAAMERQIALVEKLRLLSPTDVYRQLSEKLAYADLGTFWGFVRFTRVQNEQLSEWQLRRVRADPRRESRIVFNEDAPLDLADFPQGAFAPKDHVSLLQATFLHLAILVALIGAALVLACWRFDAYDPRHAT